LYRRWVREREVVLSAVSLVQATLLRLAPQVFHVFLFVCGLAVVGCGERCAAHASGRGHSFGAQLAVGIVVVLLVAAAFTADIYCYMSLRRLERYIMYRVRVVAVCADSCPSVTRLVSLAGHGVHGLRCIVRISSIVSVFNQWRCAVVGGVGPRREPGPQRGSLGGVRSSRPVDAGESLVSFVFPVRGVL
jgi:hypothetical protein